MSERIPIPARDHLLPWWDPRFWQATIARGRSLVAGAFGALAGQSRAGQPGKFEKGRIAEGNAIDAAARMLVYVGKAQHRIEKPPSMTEIAAGEVSLTKFKALGASSGRSVSKALPQLLPLNATARRAFSELIQSTVAATANLKPMGNAV
jgi:hypothetical protein